MLQYLAVGAIILLLISGAVTWMTTRQAAEELGMTENGVREMIKRGELRADKFGGRDWRIDPESVKNASPHKEGFPRGRKRKLE